MINSEWRKLISEQENFKETVMAEHTADNVNSPAHYGKGKIECIDYIEDFLTKEAVSYTHSPSPRDRQKSRMPSSA